MPNLEQELAKLLWAIFLRSSILRKGIGNCLWHGRLRLFWPFGVWMDCMRPLGCLTARRIQQLGSSTSHHKALVISLIACDNGWMISYYALRP
jgi:hypothetical protein